MPLDPNISLSFQPPQIQSPLAAIGQVQALKNQQLQSQSSQLELEQQQRQLRAQDAMGAAMANAFKTNPDGSMEFDTQKIAQGVTVRGAGYAVPGLIDNLNKANASIADLQKKRADLLETQNDLKGFTANAVKEHFSPSSLIGGLTALSAHKLMDPDTANQAVQDIQAHQDDLNYLHQKYDPLIDQMTGASKGVQTMRGTQMRGEAQMGELRLKQRTTALNALAGAPNDAAYQQTLARLQDSGVPADVLKEFQGAWTPERQQQLVSLTQTPQERVQAPGQAAQAEFTQAKLLAPQLSAAARNGTYAQAWQGLAPNIQKYYPDPATNPKDLDVLRAGMTASEVGTSVHEAVTEKQGAQRIGIEQAGLGVRGAELAVTRMNAGLDPKTGEPIQYTDEQGNPINVSPVAAAIAAYKLPPANARSMVTAQGRNLMNQVLAVNKGFDIGQYEERYKTMQDLRPAGKIGQQSLAINTLIRHTDDMMDAVTALKNGDLQGLNAIKQRVAQWTGSAAPTNFDQWKQFVVGETVKAIRGSGGSVEDEKNAAGPLNKANSPEQLLGAMNINLAATGGKLRAINQAVRPIIGDPNFTALDPDAADSMRKRGYDPQTLKPTAQGGAATAGAIPVKDPNGKTHYFKSQDAADAFKKSAGIQ